MLFFENINKIYLTSVWSLALLARDISIQVAVSTFTVPSLGFPMVRPWDAANGINRDENEELEAFSPCLHHGPMGALRDHPWPTLQSLEQEKKKSGLGYNLRLKIRMWEPVLHLSVMEVGETSVHQRKVLEMSVLCPQGSGSPIFNIHGWRRGCPVSSQSVQIKKFESTSCRDMEKEGLTCFWVDFKTALGQLSFFSYILLFSNWRNNVLTQDQSHLCLVDGVWDAASIFTFTKLKTE